MSQQLTAKAGELRGGRMKGREGFLEEARLELSPEGFGKLKGEEASRSGAREAGPRGSAAALRGRPGPRCQPLEVCPPPQGLP